MTSIKKRLARGSLWISAARGSAGILNSLSLIVLARLLMPDDFGIVAIAATLVAILSGVTELSSGSAIIHLREPTPEHYHTAWTFGLTRGLLLAVTCALLATPVADWYGDERLTGVMYVLGANILLTGLANPSLIALQKQLEFKQQFILNSTGALITALSSIVLAIIYRSYWALVFGNVVGTLAAIIVSYTLYPYRPRFTWSRFRDIWSYSSWLWLSQLVNSANYRIDPLIIGGHLGAQTLGYYTVGGNLATRPTSELTRPLTQTLFPAFSLVSDDPRRLQDAYLRAQSMVTAIAFPTAIGFALIADPMVRLLLGENWLPAILVIQVLSCVFSIATLGSLVNPLTMAVGDTRFLFRRGLQKLLIRIPAILLGMYLWGLLGVLIARGVAGAIGVALEMTMVRSLAAIPIVRQLLVNTRCFVSTGIMAACVLGAQSVVYTGRGTAELVVAIGASVLVGVALYPLATYVLWRLSGRPAGPEQEAIAAGQALLQRIRARRGQQPHCQP